MMLVKLPMVLMTFRNWSGRCQATVNSQIAPELAPEMARSSGSFEMLYSFFRTGSSSSTMSLEYLWVAVHRCCCGYPRHSQGKEPCAKSRKRLLWRLITVIPLTARLNGFGRESAAMTPRLFRPRVGVG